MAHATHHEFMQMVRARFPGGDDASKAMRNLCLAYSDYVRVPGGPDLEADAETIRENADTLARDLEAAARHMEDAA